MLRPPWAFENQYLCKIVFISKDKTVVCLEGFEHNWDILPLLFQRSTTYVLIWIPAAFNKSSFDIAITALESQAPKSDPRKVTWLCNTPAQTAWAQEAGFSSLFCNHNAFINEDVFSPLPGSLKNYDLVINSRPESWKRPWLASGIEKLAVIQGFNHRKEDYYDLNQLNPLYINKSRLTASEVNKIYNQSKVGGIFSGSEGACLSSSEYLLAGIPVISTASEGGRDVFYNKFNSFLCDPDPQSVSEGVKLVIQGIESNQYKPLHIRNMHLAQANGMRVSLAAYLRDTIGFPWHHAADIIKQLVHQRISLITASMLECSLEFSS